MLRIAIAVSALALMASAAQAEPVKLTTAEMDGVTAGLTVNGKVLVEFTLDRMGTAADPTDDVPTMEVVAGGQSVFLPAPVHDNFNQGQGDAPFGVGTGPWSAFFGSDQSSAATPIVHDPVTIVNPAP